MQPIYVFPTGVNAIQENGAQQWLEINKRFHCFDSNHFLEAQIALLRHISWHVGVTIRGNIFLFVSSLLKTIAWLSDLLVCPVIGKISVIFYLWPRSKVGMQLSLVETRICKLPALRGQRARHIPTEVLFSSRESGSKNIFCDNLWVMVSLPIEELKQR